MHLRGGAACGVGLVARWDRLQDVGPVAVWGRLRGEAACTCGVGLVVGWGRLRGWAGCGVGTSIVWCVACVALRDTT